MSSAGPGLISRVAQQDIAAPGANTDILSSALTPKFAGVFEVELVLATASVFNYTQNDGTNTRTLGLDRSRSLTAGDSHRFRILVHPSFTYNFQVETDGIIRKLFVNELPDATGAGSDGSASSTASLSAGGIVTVSGVTPLAGATNLGKAVDAAAGAADVGVAALAQRKDTLAALTPASGDYSRLLLDSTGQLWVRDDAVRTTTSAATVALQLLDNAVNGNSLKVTGYNNWVAKDVAYQSAAYAAEDCLGGKFVFSSVTRNSGLGCIVKSIQFVDEGDARPELHLFLSDRALTSAPADNASMSATAAASFGATDRDNIQGPFTISSSDWENIDGSTAVARIDLGHVLKSPNAGRDYGAILKVGSAVSSAGAARNMRVTLEVLQD